MATNSQVFLYSFHESRQTYDKNGIAKLWKLYDMSKHIILKQLHRTGFILTRKCEMERINTHLNSLFGCTVVEKWNFLFHFYL